MASLKTNVLITGSGRGLGFAMAKIFLSRPNTNLVALVRDPTNQPNLDSVTPGTDSSVLKIKYDASEPTSASAAIKELQDKHGIDYLDIVIPNAGVGTYFGPSIAAPADHMIKEFIINAVGPVTLFQATAPLMQKAKEVHPDSVPKFFAISSLIGSTSMIAKNPQVSVLPYGSSKAALNHAMVKFHGEFPDFIVGIVTPGRTRTEFARDAVRNMGARNTASALSFHTAEESAEGLVSRIDKATREGDSGRFFDWDEGEISW